MSTLWGIDLGGTKIEGIVLTDEEHPTVLSRKRIPTLQERGYGGILERISELVLFLSREVGALPSALGVGTPGVSDPRTGLQKNSNTQCLNGKPLQADLAQKLGIPVRLANDANCFALAEALLGAGVGKECIFGVILGTGVGGGIVINNKVRVGVQGIAGEWGHNILEVGGASCYCGKRGCVETVLSGPALERFYEQLSGERRALSEIVRRANEQNDEIAQATITRLTTYFGQAIAEVINILDPEVIVLGGGVSNVSSLYTEGVSKVSSYLFSEVNYTQILPNKLGDSAGVFGAAFLARDIR